MANNDNSDRKVREKKSIGRMPTSLKVDPELWEEVKIMSIRTKKNITEYFEEALKEKLRRDYQTVMTERQRRIYEDSHEQKQELPTSLQSMSREKLVDYIINNPELREKVLSFYSQESIDLHVKFPASKNEILESVKMSGHNTPSTIETVRNMPDRTYDSMDDFDKFFIEIHNKLNKEYTPINDDNAHVISKDQADSDFPIVLYDIAYPINKAGLIESAKKFINEIKEKHGKVPILAEHALFILENLPNPDKLYESEKEIQSALDSVVNDKGVNENLLSKPSKIRGCFLMTIPPVAYGERNELMQEMIDHDAQLRQIYAKQQEQRRREESGRKEEKLKEPAK
jgi:hypothetical protein